METPGLMRVVAGVIAWGAFMYVGAVGVHTLLVYLLENVL